ncbi:MAG: ABC transporter substrate-binding protein [Acidimicrobiales bacterium]
MRPDPISRRRFLGLASAGAAAATLSACGAKSYTPGGSPSSDKGKGARVLAGPPGPGPVSGGLYGGTATVAWESEANSFDPALGYNLQAWDAITSLLFTPLYEFAGQYGGAAPALAASMPVVSDGGTRYVIKLRPDAKFSNGRAIVADDYIYSWTRVLDPKLASWASSYLQPIVGADAVMGGKATTLSGVSAIDDLTLEIRLTAPTFTFLNQLAQPYAAAVPKEAVEALGNGFGTKPVGNGPFVITEYSDSDQSAAFVANKHYAWKGLPYLSGVEYHWGINAQLELLQLEKGAVELIGDGIGPSLAAQVEAEPSLKKYTDPIQLNATAWIALNCASGPLSDNRVRQALNWATDREAIANVTHGEWEAWGYPLPKELADYTRKAKPFGYDVKMAKALLSEAGVSHLQVKFLTDGSDPWADVSQIIQQQWKAVGVDLVIDTVSTTTLDTVSTTLPLRVDSFEDDYYMVQPSALDLIMPNFTSSGAYNTVSYKNPTVDSLVNKAEAQTTLAESNVYVAQIEQALVADPPGVFLFNVGFLAGRSPALHNYQYRGETGSYYDRMWI